MIMQANDSENEPENEHPILHDLSTLCRGELTQLDAESVGLWKSGEPGCIYANIRSSSKI